MSGNWLPGIFGRGPSFRLRLVLICAAIGLAVDAIYKSFVSWRHSMVSREVDWFIASLLLFAAWWLRQSEDDR